MQVGFGRLAFAQPREEARARGVSFGRRLPPHIPPTNPSLMRLFELLPKAELHCHLGGSTPIGDIRVFMRENGLTEAQIRQMTRLRNRYKSLDHFLETYYKVPAQVKTPEQFRRATIGLIQEAARENVRYFEIRSSILAKGDATPVQIVDAIEAGMREGMAWVKQNRGFDMNVGLLVLAQRAGTPEQSMESARLAVELSKRPGSLIRGFDLAGSEGQHSVMKHAEALRYIKANGMPLTVHAGEIPTSEGISGVDSIKAALALGADRIGHGLQVVNDPQLMREMVQTQKPFEVAPWSNVQIDAVSNFKAHPFPQMWAAGLNVSLSTDNRMMSKITLSQQLAQIYANELLPCWEQVKQLSLNGVRGAFVPPLEKMRLLSDFGHQFRQLEAGWRDVINHYFCKACPHPKAVDLQQKRLA